jgi:beta-glucanase (GH16 family)
MWHFSTSSKTFYYVVLMKYLIMNLGMSFNYGAVDLQHLVFPTTMRVDWIRVYQPENETNIGCDPKNFPTAAYIDK